MSTFQYRALKGDGDVTKGTADGRNRAEVMRQLSSRGFQVLSVEEVEQKASAKAKVKEEVEEKPKTRAPQENRLSSKQMIQFTEELSDMLAAGVQLDSSLSSIAKRSESPLIAKVAEVCYEKVRDGSSLAGALKQASPSFSDMYCNLVAAGEVSGALGDILRRQVAYLTTMSELKGKLASAMIYPAFLVMSGIGVGAMMVFFLLPKLQDLVESTGGELPAMARIMMSTGHFFQNNWVVVFVLIVVCLVVGAVLFRRPSVKYAWDEQKLKIPMFGKLVLTRFNVQFVETLSNLLSNGLPLVKALDLVEGTTPNRHIQEKIGEISGKVSEGALLNRSMEKAKIFEPGLIDMVRIGEDTGRLAESMSKAGVRLDREFSRAIDRMASVIQPAIILVMSVLVGAMAYTMISVIYETISLLRS